MSPASAVRAAVMTDREDPLEIHDVELRPLGPNEVRLRIGAAGVCHSDLSYLNGTLATELPIVLGHEAAGVVVGSGSDVRRVTTGTRVVVNRAPPCRRCWFCLRGEPWLCERPRASTDPIGTLEDGTPVRGALGVGAFAEEAVVDEAGVVPLPPGIPIEVGALLGCTVLNGVGAVRNTARVAPGETVAVVGLGGVGLSAVAGPKVAGASSVIAIDRSADKEPLAKALGPIISSSPVTHLPKTCARSPGGGDPTTCSSVSAARR